MVSRTVTYGYRLVTVKHIVFYYLSDCSIYWLGDLWGSVTAVRLGRMFATYYKTFVRFNKFYTRIGIVHMSPSTVKHVVYPSVMFVYQLVTVKHIMIDV